MKTLLIAALLLTATITFAPSASAFTVDSVTPSSPTCGGTVLEYAVCEGGAAGGTVAEFALVVFCSGFHAGGALLAQIGVHLPGVWSCVR